MKRLITIILALIMALFTAPNRGAEQPPVTAVKTPQAAIVTQVEQQIPEQSTNTPVNATYEPTEPHPEPVPRKIRKSGTGCIYQINDHLWEGSFYPRLPNGKRKKFNVYAETREQCEVKLAEMITQKKAEIAQEKANQKEGAD